ncbi:hypothetical protein Cs7R123_16900 [Catellatospora sp. TT07R-123]|uniref:hypothetical protein n=1 Tax=Catellatospora sp. TT07R-123 TaxID=2733863 RepID=UPI001B0495BB|nr:hypothetical protein [Catellatospora sp. TT07R-123]GHJ44348.1 hypothetical protein Cs7R123_16900 [Catellatospora sp. TT07R-123]
MRGEHRNRTAVAQHERREPVPEPGDLLADWAADGGCVCVRVLTCGDVVAVHSLYPNMGPGFVGFDIFRMADGVPAEHWSVLQPLARPGGQDEIGGPRTVSQPRQSSTSRRVVDYLVDNVLVPRDFEHLCRFVTTGLKQHRPGVADGIGGWWEQLRDQDVRYERRHLTVADGEFALTICTGTVGGRPTAFYDLFRLEHAMIAEHWGVQAGVPERLPYSNSFPPYPSGTDPTATARLAPAVTG